VKLNRVLEAIGEVTGLTFAEVGNQLSQEKFTFSIKEAAKLEWFDEGDIASLKGDYPLLFGVEPRKAAVIKEVAAPIKKNNGASGNGHSGEAIIESVANSKKEAQVAGIMQSMKLTENAARSFLGLKPKGPAGLDAKQAKSYAFARAVGLNESDAMKVAKL
jgi:hypothetical protein